MAGQTATRMSLASRLPVFLFIAWRNIWRYPVRSVLTISALSGSLVMVILYAALLAGMERQMVRYATELSSSHVQVHRQEYIDNQDLYATLPWAYLQEVGQAHPALKVAPRLYAAGLASTDVTSNGVLVKAVDPALEQGVTQMLRHTRQGEASLGVESEGGNGLRRHHVVIGSGLARNMELGPGSELVLVTQAADGSIGNALFVVSAVLRPLEPAFDRLGVLMSVDAYRELMYLEDGFHELAVHVDDIDLLGEARASVERALDDLQARQPLDELGGPVVVRSWDELNPAVAEMLEFSNSTVFFIGFIIVLLASLGMLNTMMMAVHERTHEFGILLAIGMRRGWLLAMVLLESLMLSAVSVVVGILLGVWVGGYLEEPGLDFSSYVPDGYDMGGLVFEPVMKGWMETGDIIAACVLVVVVASLSSLIPSWRVVRLKPVEALR